jgi:ABC-type sugar transport system ATPase subunit
MNNNILEIRNLCKSYPGVEALKDVSLTIQRNTVHCIVGENGAGKSTFIKILTRAEERSSGTILFDDTEFRPRTIKEAMNLGISTLFQELNVVNKLTVEENLMLGREEAVWGVIRRPDRESRVFQILKDFAPDISLSRKVDELSYAEKQVIEIVKAMAVDASLLIMDEPTAALSEAEAQRLFQVIRTLKQQEITVIYISHILDDIFAIGDYVTVFRDGAVIGTSKVSEIDRPALIKMMIGKVVTERYVPRQVDYSTKVLEVADLRTSKLDGVSFDLYKGEIIGFYGLRGAGKSEIAQALYGLGTILAGTIKIGGRPVRFGIPRDSLRRGIAMVPEERLSEGLILKMPLRPNITISNLKKITRFAVVNSRKERDIAERYVKALSIKASGIDQRTSTLSGGNQQKVVISKCLNADSTILLMDEPTRGIDVGAKEEIHKIIRSLAGEGNSVIIFSSEYPEILTLCDRIFLVADGRIIKVAANKELTAEELLHIITQVKRKKHESG